MHEYAACYSLHHSLTELLASTLDNIQILDHSMPGYTSSELLHTLHHKINQIRSQSSEIFNPSTGIATPWSHSYTAGCTIIKMPTRQEWIKEYNKDPGRQEINRMLKNPGLIKKENLLKIHYVYRAPLRHMYITQEDGLLYLKERLMDRDTYVKLQIVPKSLRNIIFIAFHSNPAGAHFSLYQTFHKIRLRYFWPGMYAYVSQ